MQRDGIIYSDSKTDKMKAQKREDDRFDFEKEKFFIKQ